MSAAVKFIIGTGAAAYALVALSAFLILIGRRAGWFGLFASAIFTLYLVLVLMVSNGVISDESFEFGDTWGETLECIARYWIAPALPVLLGLLFPLSLLLYGYRRYRQSRQEEVFQVIATAVESNVPLAPALQAYLMDRPRDGRAAWDAALMLLCPPGYPLWTQRRTFDDRVARLSAFLGAGAPLPEALRLVPGIAPPEVTVAAEVGDTTGRLAVCLRRADRDRLAGAWLELLPRVLYPLLLLLFISGVTGFLGVAIIPKFKRIFDDFQMRLPPVTEWLVLAMVHVADFLPLIVLGTLGAGGLGIMLWLSPWVRWHMPLVGRLFRWEAQGLVLRMLGTLFEVGRTAPEALGLLADAPDLSSEMRRRLHRAMVAVQRGEPLTDALYANGLVPEAMVPLLSASERTHTLPLALTEIGDLLAGRAVRMARRASLVIAPLLIVAIGILVGIIVVGVFTPLIKILTDLSR